MRGEKLTSPVPEAQIFSISNAEDFDRIALQVYQFQYYNNPVYGEWCRLTGKPPEYVKNFGDIPYLPISFFKTHEIKSGTFHSEIQFRSSGTTAATTSKHEVASLDLYRESFRRAFQLFHGAPTQYCILALLPDYGRHGASSLLFMVEDLVQQSNHPLSSFMLNREKEIVETLEALKEEKVLLIGVSWALYDLALNLETRYPNLTVVETGGMKGRSKELTRDEIAEVLKKGLGVSHIYSEYGMTELLSQAYGVDGVYKTPPWMRLLLRDETDPFKITQHSGAINVVDLANIYSCSFIATEDRGRFKEDGIEVLGRLDNTDIRGCSLLI